MLYLSLPCLENFVIYISCKEIILTLHLNYIWVCIDMFVHLIVVYVCIIIVYVIQSNCRLFFVLGTLSYASPMYGLVFYCIFVKFTFELICLWMLYLCFLWCTSYNLLFGCATPWEYFHAHFLYIICYAILLP